MWQKCRVQTLCAFTFYGSVSALVVKPCEAHRPITQSLVAQLANSNISLQIVYVLWADNLFLVQKKQ